MKKLLLLFFLTLSFNFGHSQFFVEGQAGGVNFIGVSIGSGYRINLDKNNKHHLTPQVGFGTMLPIWHELRALVNLGVDYQYKGWGVGIALSKFDNRYGYPDDGFIQADFVDVIIYPNISYTFSPKSSTHWYCKVTSGAYLAFSHNNTTQNPIAMEFQGDALPGAGFGLGYRF
ncbi:MAG: hypothetical protein MI810_24885 [Flavobacteriales bacterium]|nr:hypothetical protein [Flavobacteriales bacterium]